MSWEMFGYPEFMLQDADELIDAQYAGHPALRPIADAVLAWAAETGGAQLTRANNTSVDVTLRLGAAAAERLIAVKVRAGDFCRTVEEIAGEPHRGLWRWGSPAAL